MKFLLQEGRDREEVPTYTLILRAGNLSYSNPSEGAFTFEIVTLVLVYHLGELPDFVDATFFLPSDYHTVARSAQRGRLVKPIEPEQS